MEQVLNNLIQNAKNHVCDSGEIHLSVSQREDKLHFSIFNQGEQIPPQDISMIWEKFYRGKSSQYSTLNSSGLGLSIVAQILSMYKMDYGVQNKPNGVEFYFDFSITA